MTGNNRDRDERDSDRWHVDCVLEGWLQLNDSEAEPIEVRLVDYSSGGIQVVLSSNHPLQPGQQGLLITQSHGAGCCRRPVQCTWQSAHPHNPQLQSAGFCFRTEPSQMH